MINYDKEIQVFFTRSYPIESAYCLSQQEKTLIEEKLKFFNTLTDPFSLSNGEESSLNERESIQDSSDITLTYGEIDFYSMAEIFCTINQRYGGLSDGVFYDLGSGMGKCVLATALLTNFSKCKGIEILSGLYQYSLQLKQRFDEDFPNIIAENRHLFTNFSQIEFTQGDIFDFDWKDASLIFANSTCFSHEMMRKIGERPLKCGTIGISFTEVFIGDGWIILERIRKVMSWGQATVYIQRYIGSEYLAKYKSVYLNN